MPRLTNRNPSYRRHRVSGQAVVTLNGRDHYLGPYGTKASKNEYDRLIGEWLSNGRRVRIPASDLTIAELVAAFWNHAEKFYLDPNGLPTGEADNFKYALRPLLRLYGGTFVTDFGPLSLKALMAEMCKAPTADRTKSGRGWCRNSVNRGAGRIKQVFRWGVENEMVPSPVYEALKAVTGLKKGKSEARESDPVKPVPLEFVYAILPHVSGQVAAMVKLQLLTGMRSAEVVTMRGCDLDTTGTIWIYRPARHKTQHHGHDRVVPIGRRGQELIKPYLKPDLTATLFCPADAERERRQLMHEKRKTPMSCGNRPGVRRVRDARRRPGSYYSVCSYRKAISRACDWADLWAKGGKIVGSEERIILSFHPHQLRHNAATRLRKEFGLEAAQVILGHKSLVVTQIYAETNQEMALQIAEKAG